MTPNTHLLQHLFGKSSLAEISEKELLEMIKAYPYFAHVRWLLAEKKWIAGRERQALFQAGPYAFQPLRLIQHFSKNHPATPLIQPLFTEDYFAYTGAKLPEHIANDKKPTMEQLHSFTDWLRTMKRPRGTTDPDIREDEALLAAHQESEDTGIQSTAEDSVYANENVFTEAMAEVRVGKGQIDKAIAIYEKLSLSNPEKSAYFAQKIEALKTK